MYVVNYLNATITIKNFEVVNVLHDSHYMCHMIHIICVIWFTLYVLHDWHYMCHMILYVNQLLTLYVSYDIICEPMIDIIGVIWYHMRTNDWHYVSYDIICEPMVDIICEPNIFLYHIRSYVIDMWNKTNSH